MNKETSLKSRIGKLHITLKIGLIIFLIGDVPLYIVWGLDALGIISVGFLTFATMPTLIWPTIILIVIGIVQTIRKRKKPQNKEFVKPNKMKWETVILIILIGILCGGFAFWVGENNEWRFLVILGSMLSFFGPFLGPLILTLILNEQPWKIALLIIAGVIIAFMFGIFYSEDAGTIWPLWLGIVITFTLPSAFVGSYLAQLTKYIKSKSIATV